MVALNVAPFPQNLKRLRVDASRARRPESDVDSSLFDHRRRRSMRVERMYVLRLSDVEQFPIPDHLPGVTVNAQHKQFPSVRARGSQPDLLSIDHGRRPTTAVYRGLPEDIPGLAPMQGQTARIRMPSAVRPAKLRPILGSAHRRTRQHQKGGE